MDMKFVFLTSILHGEKMRNELAETMRDSLSNGKVLDGAVDLLEQTSIMITIFRDQRLITTKDDLRLSQIRNILEWFRNLLFPL
jgi:hypothetical protein